MDTTIFKSYFSLEMHTGYIVEPCSTYTGEIVYNSTMYHGLVANKLCLFELSESFVL